MRHFLALLFAVTIVDFSIIDIDKESLKVEAYADNGTTCIVELNKKVFFSNSKEFVADLVKEVLNEKCK